MTTATIVHDVQSAGKDTEEKLFSGAHAALTFAYNHSAQVYERPLMSRLADGAGIRAGQESGKGLGGVDGAAQAGMILSKVEKLSRLHKAIIVGRFAPQAARCPCCKSPTDDLDWLAAIRIISDAGVGGALSTHISFRVLRDAIVVRYFGKKDVKLSAAADMAGVSAATATNHNSAISIWLRGTRTTKQQDGNRGDGKIGEESVALAHITDLLSAQGICK